LCLPERAVRERVARHRQSFRAFVEVRREIKDGTLAIAGFHDPQEVAELPVNFRTRRTALAVAGKFKVHGRRQRHRVVRHGTQEVGRLSLPAAAQPEEMIGAAVDARSVGSVPIPREAPVDMVGAFSRLDIGEVDALARQLRPSDVSLMMRDVDALIRVSSLRRTPSVSGSCGACSCKDRN